MIPVNEPRITKAEKEAVAACLEQGWISSEGPFVPRFEEAFARLVNRRRGIAVANGTAALEIAVKALGIGQGDEVIMPTLTIISPAAAVVRCGALPVLVDSERRTWNMDVGQIEGKITPRTRAIIVVHLYGLPVDMDPLLNLAARYGLSVIEDAAEMHGQTYRGRPCGSFGTLSTFSFYANKHITTGEGGIIVTDDDELDGRCRSLRNLCFGEEHRFVHQEMGWNYRLTSIQAALGLSQLDRLGEIVRRKRRIGGLYTERLQDIEALELPPAATDYGENIYWVYGLILKETASLTKRELMARLAALGVGTRPFFWPMHEQPVFQRQGLFPGEAYPVAERLARQGFYLPSGLALEDEQIEQVAAVLRRELS